MEAVPCAPYTQSLQAQKTCIEIMGGRRAFEVVGGVKGCGACCISTDGSIAIPLLIEGDSGSAGREQAIRDRMRMAG